MGEARGRTRLGMLGWILACGLLTVATGCVHRSLTIRTDPPGARVYVNDALKGDSPVTYDFTWYGWHRLTIRKEGFERLDDRRILRAPLYLWIPLDFVMELMPFRIRDTRTWSYTLTPASEPASPVPPGAVRSTSVGIQAEVRPKQPPASELLDEPR